jgi:hypothetical protein
VKRVIVESPFAPQTPPSDSVCTNARNGSCGNVAGGGGYDSYNPCPKCKNEIQRNKELHRNRRYLAAALCDCVLRGESPYASHGLLTLPGVLRDDVPEERARGIKAGFVWREAAHATVIYTDLGWSSGMRAGEEDAKRVRAVSIEVHCSAEPAYHDLVHRIEYRTLGPDWDRK